MVLVGWSNGLFQALNANTGTIVWQYRQVNSWGITGSMLIEGETVTIPTRRGIDKLCLDGAIQFSHEIGLGWRNGVTFVGDSYWVGDEEGNLWSANNQKCNKTLHRSRQNKTCTNSIV